MVQVVYTPNPSGIARLSAPGGMVDGFTYGLAQAIAATAQGLAPRDTGELANSIETERVSAIGWAVVAKAPYSLAVHEGTKAHEIRPKSGKVLRFPSKGGKIVFTKKVNHPGSAPNPFLEEAMISVLGSSARPE